MPRVARIVIPNTPHHIVQRGNNCQDVFFVDDDRRVYLSILREQSEKYGLEVLGWCLMSNHIHLVAQTSEPDSLANAVGRTHFHYTQYINRMHHRSGHLWQNRFYSCPLDREHFWHAMRYVEQNPVRAKLAALAWEYPWSSAAAHVDNTDRSGLLNMANWRKMAKGLDWRRTLDIPQSREQLLSLRNNTHTGRPLGGDSFISKLEVKLNKRLRPLPVGRPRLNDGVDAKK